MPRGNDAVDAAKELSERYQASGNAEDLIASQRASRSQTLRKASLLPVDVKATQELDSDAVKKDSGAEGDILSATVRGDYVSYVEQLPNGRTRKGAYSRKASDEERKEQQEQEQAPVAARARQAQAANEAQREEAEQQEAARKQAAEQRSSQQKQGEKPKGK